MKLYKLGSWLRWLANRVDPPPKFTTSERFIVPPPPEWEPEILRTAVGNVEVPASMKMEQATTAYQRKKARLKSVAKPRKPV